MEQKDSRVKWIVSLPAHQALIAVLLFAIIYLAAENQFAKYNLRQCNEKNDKILYETQKELLDFYVKATESRQNIQNTTDSIAADAKEIKRITNNHFLKMQKIK